LPLTPPRRHRFLPVHVRIHSFSDAVASAYGHDAATAGRFLQSHGPPASAEDANISSRMMAVFLSTCCTSSAGLLSVLGAPFAGRCTIFWARRGTFRMSLASSSPYDGAISFWAPVGLRRYSVCAISLWGTWAALSSALCCLTSAPYEASHDHRLFKDVLDQASAPSFPASCLGRLSFHVSALFGFNVRLFVGPPRVAPAPFSSWTASSS